MKAYLEHVPTGPRSFNLYRYAPAAFPMNWHYHPECELTLLETGRGQRLVGDSVETYEQNDLVLIGPGVPHTWCSQGSPLREGLAASHQSAVVIQFKLHFLGETFIHAPEVQPIHELLERAAAGLVFGTSSGLDMVRQLLTALPDRAPGEQLLGLIQALYTLATTTDVRPLSSLGFQPISRPRDHVRIDTICNYFNSHYAQPMQLEVLAKQARMNPAALCRYFKRATGHTLTSYLNEIRISQASRLLIETQIPIVHVGSKVGYASHSHFNKQFNRIKGVSPGVFRKQYRIHHAKR